MTELVWNRRVAADAASRWNDLFEAAMGTGGTNQPPQPQSSLRQVGDPDVGTELIVERRAELENPPRVDSIVVTNLDELRDEFTVLDYARIVDEAREAIPGTVFVGDASFAIRFDHPENPLNIDVSEAKSAAFYYLHSSFEGAHTPPMEQASRKTETRLVVPVAPIVVLVASVAVLVGGMTLALTTDGYDLWSVVAALSGFFLAITAGGFLIQLKSAITEHRK